MPTSRGQQLIGKVLGSCVIERLLSYGGSSAVFLAQQSTAEQKVAIKVFLPRSPMDTQMQKDFYYRFLCEAEAVSQLDHPHILPIYSYGEQDGLPYIIMPYMEGGTLSEYVAEHGCLSLEDAQWYLEQIASALDYAHQEHGYVHCDVKPANILLDSDGSAMLTDFGIIHMMHPETTSGDLGQPTKPPQVLMGTPVYISPEQALGQPLDGRSDIYSLGITLFYLLTGRLPFKADSTLAIALLQVHETPPSLCLLRADISPTIDSVIQKALAKQPEDRYATAGEFSAAFAQAIQDSARVYHIDSGSKAPVLPAKYAEDWSTGALHALLTAKPVVRVKPTSPRRTYKHLWIVAALLLLLLVIVSATLAGGEITSHFAQNAPPKVRVQLPVSANVLGDDLANNEDWPTGGAFFFTGEQYHIQNKSARAIALAFYANHQYTNFRLTVTATEIHGSGDGGDYYGIAFRGSSDQSHYYLFEIDAAWNGEQYGQYGQYQFLRYDSDDGWITLANGSAPSLVNGIGKSNAITVESKGRTFSFLINGTRLGSPVTDSSNKALSRGEVGLAVEEQGSEVVFSHLDINILK